MRAMLSPGQKQGRARYGLACFQSSVNASAWAECLLDTENLASVNGPNDRRAGLTAPRSSSSLLTLSKMRPTSMLG